MRTVLPFSENLIYKTLTSIKRGLRGRQPMRRMLPQRRWECCTSAGGGFKCSKRRDKISGDNSGAKHAGGARTPWIASKDSSSFSLERCLMHSCGKEEQKYFSINIHFIESQYPKNPTVVFSVSQRTKSCIFWVIEKSQCFGRVSIIIH